MNKRIKELEIQCWEPRQYGPAWFNSTKFAELIVRECVILLRNEPVGNERIGGQNFKTIQLGESVALLHEYFGIKE